MAQSGPSLECWIKEAKSSSFFESDDAKQKVIERCEALQAQLDSGVALGATCPPAPFGCWFDSIVFDSEGNCNCVYKCVSGMSFLRPCED